MICRTNRKKGYTACFFEQSTLTFLFLRAKMTRGQCPSESPVSLPLTPLSAAGLRNGCFFCTVHPELMKHSADPLRTARFRSMPAAEQVDILSGSTRRTPAALCRIPFRTAQHLLADRHTAPRRKFPHQCAVGLFIGPLKMDLQTESSRNSAARRRIGRLAPQQTAVCRRRT